MSELAVGVYLDAVDWLIDLVAREEIAESWEAPSALARYSVGGVAVHAVLGGVVRLCEALVGPEPSEGRRVKLTEYFALNRIDDPKGDDPLFVALRSGAEEIARQGHASLCEMARGARVEVAHLLTGAPADRAIGIMRIPDATTTLDEYVRTRILEVVVHGDDLVASVAGAQMPDPPAAALEECLGVCVELVRARLGDRGALRAFTRSERADPGALRVL